MLRSLVIFAGCFLLLTGFRTDKNLPGSHSVSQTHVTKSLPVNDNDVLLITDELGDEDERIYNALARKFTILDGPGISTPDLFDLHYLNCFIKDRFSFGQLPVIYIKQRALRI